MDWFGVVVFALGVHAVGMIVHLWMTHGKQGKAHEALCYRVSSLERQQDGALRRLSDLERQSIADAACLRNLVCTTQGLWLDVSRLQGNRPCPRRRPPGRAGRVAGGRGRGAVEDGS